MKVHKHNAKILKPKPDKTNSTCSCRKKGRLPIEWKMLKDDLLF